MLWILLSLSMLVIGDWCLLYIYHLLIVILFESNFYLSTFECH